MSETGHAKNIEHFKQLIQFVKAHGALYNPTNTALQVTELLDVVDNADATMDAVTAAMGPLKVVVNAREAAFEGIRKLATKVVNSFAASGATENAIEDARGFRRKLEGARKKTLKDDPATPEDEGQGISVSQQSYTQLVEHFDDLINLLVSDGHYNPNENAIKITTLQAYSATLKTKNQAVLVKLPLLANARIGRNESLYGDGGICDLAALVKKYVKSVFGGDSPQFHQLGALEFTRPRKS